MGEVLTAPSSNIASAEYDAEAQTLDIEFHSGSTYRYFGVPPSVWRSYGLAASKGQFLNRMIIPRFVGEQQ